MLVSFLFLVDSWPGQIVVKEDKHKKVVNLFSVNRNHPYYTSFKPEKRKVEKNVESKELSGKEGVMHKTLEVVEIYKPSVHVNPIFTALGAGIGKLYSASEASDIVFQYVEKENIVKPTNPAIVVLDAILCDALFKGAIEKGSRLKFIRRIWGRLLLAKCRLITESQEAVIRWSGKAALNLSK